MNHFKILILGFLISLSFTGCKEEYTILPSEDPILLSTNNVSSLINNSIVFTATKGGEEITALTTIYVNGEAIQGDTFTSNETGEYTAYATYDNLKSNEVVFNYHDGSEINFKKRVLIEDYTGTWCGYCTRVAKAIEQVFTSTDNAVAVAIHRDSSNPNSATYDPFNYDASVLENLLNTPGYPKGFLNRTILWKNPETEYVNQVLDLTQGENPKLGLAITNSLANNQLNIEVNVKKAKNFGDLKLVVYVLENGLIYEQKNYTNYYNGVNPVPDFEHNHVLRSCLTDLLGDNIPKEEFINDVYSVNYEIAVPGNVDNADNIEIVAFVIDENGKAINVRKANLGEDQDFEQI